MKKTVLTLLAAAAALTLFAACGSDPCDAGACTFAGGTWDEVCDTDGSCSATVTDGANVKFSCPGGSCGMNCAGAEACVLDCPGGGCSLTCGATATCQITSCTAGCSLACGGAATCSSSCDLLGGCATTR